MTLGAAVHADAQPPKSARVWPLSKLDRLDQHLLIVTLVLWSAYIVHAIARGYVRFPSSDTGLLVARLGTWAVAVALTIGVWAILRRMPPGRGLLPYFLRAVGLLIVPCAVLTLFNDSCLQWLSEAYRQTERYLKPSELFVSYMNFGWIFTAWSALYATMTGADDLRRRDLQMIQARLAAQQAQLTTLRGQLQPHTLFNALNAISSLIHTRELDRAERTLISFSDFLSHAISLGDQEVGKLSAELETARLYLDVETVRFPERLKVVLEVDPKVRDCLVPNLILQPLVENAIMHGLSRSTAVVTVSIGADVSDGHLRLWVQDDARPMRGNHCGHGIGLNNIRDRLRILYGENGRLVCGPTTPGWRAEVHLPVSTGPS